MLTTAGPRSGSSVMKRRRSTTTRTPQQNKRAGKRSRVRAFATEENNVERNAGSIAGHREQAGGVRNPGADGRWVRQGSSVPVPPSNEVAIPPMIMDVTIRFTVCGWVGTVQN
jgi:hypothetical protein